MLPASTILKLIEDIYPSITTHTKRPGSPKDVKPLPGRFYLRR